MQEQDKAMASLITEEEARIVSDILDRVRG
jgi:hypothetical protein